MAAIKRVILSSVPGTLAEGTEVFVEDGSGGLDLYIGNSSNTPVLVSANYFAKRSGGNAFSGLQEFADGISFDGGSNIISAYEKGTWLPVVKVGGTAASMTGQIAKYVRVGDLVYINFRAQVTSLNGGTGNVIIEGLPFVPITNIDTGSISYTEGLSITAGHSIVARVNVGSYIELLVSDDSTGNTNMQGSEFTDDGQVRGSLMYSI